MKKKQFAILGLGQFGGNLCIELSKLDVEVLAVDKNEEKVNKYTDAVTQAYQANVMDEPTLNSLGIRNFDYVIVSLGENIEASILTTLLLKEMEIKNVWVKVHNDYHRKVLEKIGADRIIHPEKDMAVRIAHHIVSEKIIDYIELSKDYSIVEIAANKNIDGKQLYELNARTKYGVTIIALKNQNGIIVSPSADDIVHKDDIIVTMGHNQDLERFERNGI
ncbi:potassium channel family protein [Bacillus marinisedimentorum]|uniref:potassium channel family protein n=1 Tax=Bacillus marinisedimentorum TaxID=1821260 RepID=UPI000872CC70|nr:TrkA family potassium uptake protein [Bacillus marinisedimentorum]